MDYAERWRRAAADDDSEAKRAIIREIEQTPGASAVDRDVALICAALDDPDKNVRLASLSALARFAPDKPQLVVSVRDIIERSACPVNVASLARFLCLAGAAAEHALPLILQLLESMASEPSMEGGEFIWEDLLDAVAHIGPAAHDAIPLVIGSLDAATNDHVVEAAANALAKIGLPSVRPMMNYIQCEQSSDFARREVTKALGKIPVAADEVVPFLIQQLVANGTNKNAAVWALGLLGPAAKAAIPYLMEHLSCSDVTWLRALWKIQGDAALVVPKFIENVEGNDARCSVVSILGEIGPEARAAVPALRKRLFGDSYFLSVEAAVALWRIDGSEDALPVIAAAEWLISIGHGISTCDDRIAQCANEIQEWPPHVMSLRTFLGRRRLERLVATKQLKQTSPCIVPALVLIVEHTPYRRNARYRDIVAKAMDVLGAFGDKAAVAAIPLVFLRIRPLDEYHDLDTLRIQTLGRVGRGNEDAASEVARHMVREEVAMRLAASVALGRIGVGAPDIQESLVRAVHDAHPRVRAEAARSLGLLPTDAPPAVVSALIEALADSSRRVRAYAVASLGKLTPPAVDAIPALQQLLSSGGLKGLEQVVLRAIESIAQH
jgi:HEAT repeat protein